MLARPFAASRALPAIAFARPAVATMPRPANFSTSMQRMAEPPLTPPTDTTRTLADGSQVITPKARPFRFPHSAPRKAQLTMNSPTC